MKLLPEVRLTSVVTDGNAFHSNDSVLSRECKGLSLVSPECHRSSKTGGVNQCKVAFQHRTAGLRVVVVGELADFSDNGDHIDELLFVEVGKISELHKVVSHRRDMVFAILSLTSKSKNGDPLLINAVRKKTCDLSNAAAHRIIANVAICNVLVGSENRVEG